MNVLFGLWDSVPPSFSQDFLSSSFLVSSFFGPVLNLFKDASHMWGRGERNANI